METAQTAPTDSVRVRRVVPVELFPGLAKFGAAISATVAPVVESFKPVAAEVTETADHLAAWLHTQPVVRWRKLLKRKPAPAWVRIASSWLDSFKRLAAAKSPAPSWAQFTQPATHARRERELPAPHTCLLTATLMVAPGAPNAAAAA